MSHQDDSQNKKIDLRYDELLDSVRAIVWRAEAPTFHTTFTSKQVEDILGFPAAAWTSDRDLWMRQIHPEDRDRVLQYTSQETAAKRKHSFDYRIFDARGRVVWLRNIVNVIVEDGEPKELVGISVDITEGKRAEEDRFRHAAIVQSSEDAIITKNLNAVIVSWNIGAQRIFGYTEQEAVGQPITILIPPELRDEENQILERVKAGGLVEHYETIRVGKAGTKVTVSLTICPIKDSAGKLLGFCKLAHDITERKRAERALSEMAGKLIDAQEQERSRIARELHDDISQRLAMLALGLEQLKKNPSELESRARELQKQTIELSKGVHALSHDLHSSSLQYVGVVAGIQGWCLEFGERRGMQIDFRHDLRTSPPSEIGLCLFRVLQEALHNSAKHSGVKQVEVQLQDEPGEIHLAISDLGRGFDPQAANQGKGLGLTSMRERVRLVNGTITIESKPMGGTTIHVRVPLAKPKLG